MITKDILSNTNIPFVCYLGKLTNKNVADAHGYEFVDLEQLIG